MPEKSIICGGGGVGVHGAVVKGSGVAVGQRVGVAVGASVGQGVSVGGSALGVGDRVAVANAIGVTVGDGVAVGVAVGGTQTSAKVSDKGGVAEVLVVLTPQAHP